MDPVTAKLLASAAAKAGELLGKDDSGKFNLGRLLLILFLILLLPILLIAVLIVMIAALPDYFANRVSLPDNINYYTMFPADVIFEEIGEYPMPCNSSKIRSEFGSRDNPLNPGNEEFHTGIDLAAAWHSYVIAIADGTVIFSGYKPHYGRCVVVEYEDFTAYYGHLAANYAIRGGKVHKGMVLAKVGGDPDNDTLAGDSTGAHLHFEIRVDGKAVDPYPYLFENNKLNTDNESEEDIIEADKLHSSGG